jgi:ATP-binding cassette subfamily B protein RaxB
MMPWRTRRRLSFVRQVEAAECGLACLAMIFAFHGHCVDIRDLRRQFGFSMRGASLASMLRIAHHLGYSARPIRCELEALKDLQTPCILHWNLDHFVVLADSRCDSLTIHDPASGVQRLTLAQASRHFSGVALELTAAKAAFALPAGPRLRAWDFVRGIRGLWFVLPALAALAALSQLLLLGLPLFSKALVDNVIVGEVWGLLPYIAGAWTAALCMQVGLDAARSRLALQINSDYAVQLRIAVFRHLISLPIQYFHRRQTADIQHRFRALDDIVRTITEGAATVILDGIFCIFGLALVFLYSGSLALVTIVALALLVFTILRTIPAQNHRLERMADSMSKEMGIVLESIRVVQTLKLLGGEARRIAQYGNAAVRATDDQVSSAALTVNVNAATAAIQAISQLASLVLGARLVHEGHLSMGALFAFQAYQYVLLARFHASLTGFSRLRNLSVSVERAADILCEPAEFSVESGTCAEQRSAQPSGRIELSDVHYAYSSADPDVLSGIAMTIEPGECIAITGASGSGKTTLLKVLLGLLRPTKGVVLMDEQPLDHNSMQHYRASIGTVMQDDELFIGSILENICYPDERSDDERLTAALKNAHIEKELLGLPMGLATRIGETGNVLSAGQKQRLLLARALYRFPRILFLDEVTGNLDLATEAAIVDSLGTLRNVTRVVVTHRPEILRIADRIATLQQGRLIWIKTKQGSCAASAG